MKDLYAKLGLEPDAGDEDIAAALERNPALRASSTILLNPGKRAVYDGTHATVKAIGVLRYRLGLDAGQSWFLEHCPDFAPGLKAIASATRAGRTETGSAPVAPARPEPASPREPSGRSPGTGRRWLVPALALAVVLILALLAVVLF